MCCSVSIKSMTWEYFRIRSFWEFTLTMYHGVSKSVLIQCLFLNKCSVITTTVISRPVNDFCSILPMKMIEIRWKTDKIISRYYHLGPQSKFFNHKIWANLRSRPEINFLAICQCEAMGQNAFSA